MIEWISVEDFGLCGFLNFGFPWRSGGWDSTLPMQGGTGSVPVGGSEILHAVLQKVKIKKNKVYNLESFE